MSENIAFRVALGAALLTYSAAAAPAQPDAGATQRPEAPPAGPLSSGPHSPGPARTDSALQRAVDANTRFAFDLYRELAGRPGNLAFSPISISTALAMALAGARGETASQMAATLHLDADREVPWSALALLGRTLARTDGEGSQGAGAELDLANRLWGDLREPFRPQFLAELSQHFEGGLESLDLRAPGAATAINAWVAEHTRQRIRDLLAPDALAQASFVLTNAIAFRGSWAEPFDPELTRKEAFRVDAEHRVDASFMRRNGALSFAQDEGFSAVDLPFAGARFSLCVLLPDDPDGLPALERNLTPERLDAVLARMSKTQMTLVLPRFELADGFELGDTLGRLGMRAAFSGAADFTGMIERPGVGLSRVVHRAFVRVDEQGAEAAAATAVIGIRTAIPRSFRADHPFLFVLRDRESGGVLFLGRVVQP